MKKIATMTAALLAGVAQAHAGCFMGNCNWGSGAGTSQATAPPAYLDPQPRAEDNDGVRAYKLQRPSVQVYGPRYAGKGVPDGVCDRLQPNATDGTGWMAYKEAQATHYFYNTPGSCVETYYPGFTFFFGQPNMELAPHDNGFGWPAYGVGIFGTRWGG